MKQESKRFAVILICTAVGFVVLDGVVKFAWNTIEERRVNHVCVGMTEADAIRVTGHEPFALTNGVKEIMVLDHESVFDMLVLQKMTSAGRTIRIESGRVVAVNWTMVFR